MRRPIGGRPAIDLGQGHDGEDDQGDDLDAEQAILQSRGDFDAAVADIGHQGDPTRPANVDQPVLWSRLLCRPSSLARVKEYAPAI